MADEKDTMRKSPYFDELGDETFERFYACADHQTREAGEVIFTEMAVDDDFCLLLEGQVELAVKMASQDNNIIPHVLEPGSLVGVQPLITQGPRLFTCTALTPVKLLHWKAKDCEPIIEDDPAAGLHICRQVTKQLFLFIRGEREEALDRLEWGLG